MAGPYGDASLQNKILLTRRFNKFLSFNDETGELCCQAGVLLAEILDVFVPRGWFLPVTPGTKQITVGGAIAADVHGKKSPRRRFNGASYSDARRDAERRLHYHLLSGSKC